MSSLEYEASGIIPKKIHFTLKFDIAKRDYYRVSNISRVSTALDGTNDNITCVTPLDFLVTKYTPCAVLIICHVIVNTSTKVI